MLSHVTQPSRRTIQEHGGNVISGAGEMVWSKMMFETFTEIWNNRDYYGFNIRDENAPWYRQVRHTLGDLAPISESSAERALDTGGTMTKDVPLAYLGFGPAPAYVEKSAVQNRIAYLYGEHVAPASRPEEEEETSRERMRARTQLLRAIHDRTKAAAEGADQATVKKLSDAVAEASRNARAAGYTPSAIARITSTPSDVSMFSRLPEADQRAILRQADDQEFERYVTHAHMKLRAAMREERANKPREAPAPNPAPVPRTAVTSPSPAPAPAPPRSAPPPPPRRGRSAVDELLRESPLSAR
jgi:hypothetical protein